MSRLKRPCLGAFNAVLQKHEDCGEPTLGSRCVRHQAMYEATRRPSPSRRGYDKPYKARREQTLAPDELGRPRVCSLRLPGCTYWADTADHVIPVDSGRSEAGKRGPLRPACKSCNSARGKREAGSPPAATPPPPPAHDLEVSPDPKISDEDEPWDPMVVSNR